MNTRMFWLKSDGKTVQEVNSPTIQKLSRRSHIVFVHPNGELYTNRHSIAGKQFKQIVTTCKSTLLKGVV